jgi:SAM-dependent methyltransferase
MNRYQKLNCNKHFNLLISGPDGSPLNRSLSKGIEIGPFYKPAAPKCEGWKTSVVDIFSKEELLNLLVSELESYRNQIEDIDILWDWKNKSLEEEVINKIGGNLDYIISSHSIEHVVDLIEFLKSCSNILKSEGVFNLAIPDLRYTFDFFRNPSTIGQALSVYNNKSKRHSSEMFLDAIICQGQVGGHPCWPPLPYFTDFNEPYTQADRIVKLFTQKLEDSWKIYQDDKLSNNHIDFHNWVFTPSSFRLLIFELWILGIIDFTVNKIIYDDGRIGSEFFVQLVKKNKASEDITSQEIEEYRYELLSNIVIELAERVTIGNLKKK